MRKTLCVIYYDDNKFKKLAENAYCSFKAWHSDVDTILITKETYREYQSSRFINFSPGLVKYAIAYEINAKLGKKYDKIICLGADTVTLARLDEFIDDNEADMLTTLDYHYDLIQNGELLAAKDKHCNADVICFNNPEIIPKILKISIPFTSKYSKGDAYNEQAGINIMIRDNLCTWKIVDGLDKGVFYNVRAKQTHSNPDPNRLEMFYLDDARIMSPEHVQLKLWHYCEGFGHRSAKIVEERIEALSGFSNEVRSFINDRCMTPHYFIPN